MSSRERGDWVQLSKLHQLYISQFKFLFVHAVDIGPYLDRLAEFANQDNMLLNVLMDDYMNFIDILANIMDKSFMLSFHVIQLARKYFKQRTSSCFFSEKRGNRNKKLTVTYTKAKGKLKTALIRL